MNNILIPTCSEVKYLGFILDSKLTWNAFLKAKRKALNVRLRLLRPVTGTTWSIFLGLLKYVYLKNQWGAFNNQGLGFEFLEVLIFISGVLKSR